MICKNCDKDLSGGFRQDDGSHLCAVCTMHLVEWKTNRHFLNQIITRCDAMLVPGLRPSKEGIRWIRSMAKAIDRDSISERKPECMNGHTLPHWEAFCHECKRLSNAERASVKEE